MENSQLFLTKYANNPGEQAKFFGSARAASNAHAELADISALHSSIDAIAAPSFDDMLPSFRQFLASNAIRRYFEQEVECSLQSDIYQAQGQSIDNDVMTGLQFVDTEQFAVATVVADPTSVAYKKARNRDKPASIMMTPKDVLVRFIRGGGARVAVYVCEPITDQAPAHLELRCRLVRTFHVQDGDELILRAGQDSFAFESSESVVCFAQAYAKHARASVMPEFDSRSLKLIGLSATNDKASRIQMMTTILRLFQHTEAFDLCLPFARHEDYFVRWYVARELLAIDAERAWPLVAEMATHDSHPHVRNTAQQTLKLFRSTVTA